MQQIKRNTQIKKFIQELTEILKNQTSKNVKITSIKLHYANLINGAIIEENQKNIGYENINYEEYRGIWENLSSCLDNDDWKELYFSDKINSMLFDCTDYISKIIEKNIKEYNDFLQYLKTIQDPYQCIIVKQALEKKCPTDPVQQQKLEALKKIIEGKSTTHDK